MYSEVAWIVVSSGTQVRPQIIFNPDYLSEYLSVSYDYAFNKYADSKNAALLKRKLIFQSTSKLLDQS